MNPNSTLRIPAWLLLAGSALSAVAATVMGLVYFVNYWPYRDRFDAQGRYFDEATLVVYHQQSGMLLLPMLGCALLALVLGVRWVRRRRVGSNAAFGGD